MLKLPDSLKHRLLYHTMRHPLHRNQILGLTYRSSVGDDYPTYSYPTYGDETYAAPPRPTRLAVNVKVIRCTLGLASLKFAIDII
jgi:hypothetical protein